jgi:hypothetical protein
LIDCFPKNNEYNIKVAGKRKWEERERNQIVTLVTLLFGIYHAKLYSFKEMNN